MKIDKDMIKQLIIVIVGVLAALFGYDVIQGDESVTIAMPEQAEEAAAPDAEASEASTEEAAEEAAEETAEEALIEGE
jgi:hypothetical protein